MLASNEALAGYLDGLPLELRFPPRDAVALAGLIERFAAAPAADRERTGLELRRRVEEGHSVETWADQVVELVERLRRSGSAGAAPHPA